MKGHTMKKTRAWVLGAGVAVALALTSCAADTPDTPAGTNPPADSNGASADVAQYQETAEKAMEPITEWPGPDSGPVAQEGKRVMWVSGGLASEGFKAPADAAADAAEVLGWDLNVQDGQFDPRLYNRLIQEAVDQNYDAILLNGITVEAVAEAVKRARDAGIVVGSWDGGNKPSEDGVSFEVEYPVYEQGVALASYLIWKSEGDAHGYFVEAPEYNIIMGWVAGARDTFEDCATCTVVRTDQFTAADHDTRLPSMVTSALRSNPNINVLVGGYDAALYATIPAMRSAGFEDVKIGSFNANQRMAQFIRDGEALASVAEPFAWGAWASFDNLNRIFAGEEPVDQGIPFRLITAENVSDIEPNTNWDGDIDFASHFTKIWTGQ